MLENTLWVVEIEIDISWKIFQVVPSGKDPKEFLQNTIMWNHPHNFRLKLYGPLEDER